MTDINASEAELRQFIERAEQFAAEKKDIAEQEKELFAEAKPIKIPDPATVDMSMFDPNNPDFAI